MAAAATRAGCPGRTERSRLPNRSTPLVPMTPLRWARGLPAVLLFIGFSAAATPPRAPLPPALQEGTPIALVHIDARDPAGLEIDEVEVIDARRGPVQRRDGRSRRAAGRSPAGSGGRALETAAPSTGG